MEDILFGMRYNEDINKDLVGMENRTAAAMGLHSETACIGQSGAKTQHGGKRMSI